MKKHEKCLKTREIAQAHIDAEHMTDQERVNFFNTKSKDACDACAKLIGNAIFVRIPERMSVAKSMLAPLTEELYLEFYSIEFPDQPELLALLAWKAIQEQELETLADAIDLTLELREAANERFAKEEIKTIKKFVENLKNQELNGEKDTIH